MKSRWSVSSYSKYSSAAVSLNKLQTLVLLVFILKIIKGNCLLKQTLVFRPTTWNIMRPYLIFVIFFTQAKFLENKIYTEKRVNYDKLHSKLPILRVNYDKLHSKLPIFRVKSVKIYTGQKKFTRAPPVAPVTNMRYGR